MSEEKARKIVKLVNYLLALGLTEDQIIGALLIVL